MKKMLAKIKKDNTTERKYIVLNSNNVVRKDMEVVKSNISELMDKLNQITKNLNGFTKKYDDLTQEEVCVLDCGDIEVDLDSKMIKLKNLNKELALVALANIN